MERTWGWLVSDHRVMPFYASGVPSTPNQDVNAAGIGLTLCEGEVHVGHIGVERQPDFTEEVVKSAAGQDVDLGCRLLRLGEVGGRVGR